MRELTNEKFWCTDIEKIRTILLSSSTEAYDVLMVPEYFRLQQEQYEHECELKYERHKHYKENIKKLEDAEKAGYPILQYDGYVTCQGCANADFNTCRYEFDDIGLVICKNPNCPEHKKHETEND